MRARVDDFHWVDLDTRGSDWDPAHAWELLQIFVGPQGEPGSESFQLVVCTPSALAERLRSHPFLLGRHLLFVPELHPDKVTAWIADRVATLEAPTWRELAEKVGRIGAWEFEDHDS
ncbi:hypothetical protein HTZ77_36950 [Nonomuraea sp. SMC257]|uniref:Uncharacterized protein n=1 Tax=Nonomuraea montanisoli TaxID=2741721 RepID=A0A7Y6IHJ1_9ACTN|nr:Imm8 family immunity protein [Nonomuraea montanisoli]NUW36954.1 hypothetical protein [Nonomuraea montanisoli]